MECPICYGEFNEEETMMCPTGHPHACAYCLSKILSNNCSICRREVFDMWFEDATDSSDNEDSDDDESDDDLANSDYVYGSTTSIIKTLVMARGVGWWTYEVHYKENGDQEKVYIVNQSGRSLQRGKRLFYYEEDPDRVILKDEDFADIDWIMLFHYVELE